jgi:hypothetical protein
VRKILFLAFVIGGAWYVKGHSNLPPGRNAQNDGISFPNVPGGQGRETPGFLATMSTFLSGRGQPASQTTTSSVTVAHGSPKGAELTIPPELLKFINPSLLTTTPTGTRELSPEARLALQQIIAQARANPTAFTEQYAAAAKALRGQQ